MSVDAETQATFDGLMRHATTIGGMMADTVLAGAPPPWDAEWFERFYTNSIEQAGVAFSMKWPDLSETIIANMQVRFCNGLETRLKEVLGSGCYLPNGDKGAAN